MVNNVKLFVMAKTASSTVYNINHHIVWCLKYRKKILVGNLKEFLDLRHKMWKGKLWNPSYYVGTAGHVSAQTIERYIREQEKY